MLVLHLLCEFATPNHALQRTGPAVAEFWVVRRCSGTLTPKPMNITQRITRSLLMAAVFASSGCTVSDKHNQQYRGYIGAPVRAKTPMGIYINENHQIGPGSGYVLQRYPTYGSYGLVGILPVGHPVIFTKAYQSYDIGGGATWLEGSTILKRKDYYVQMPLAYGHPDKAASTLYDSFCSP